jgi:hypothetical protein
MLWMASVSRATDPDSTTIESSISPVAASTATDNLRVRMPSSLPVTDRSADPTGSWLCGLAIRTTDKSHPFRWAWPWATMDEEWR